MKIENFLDSNKSLTPLTLLIAMTVILSENFAAAND